MLNLVVGKGMNTPSWSHWRLVHRCAMSLSDPRMRRPPFLPHNGWTSHQWHSRRLNDGSQRIGVPPKHPIPPALLRFVVTGQRSGLPGIGPVKPEDEAEENAHLAMGLDRMP